MEERALLTLSSFFGSTLVGLSTAIDVDVSWLLPSPLPSPVSRCGKITALPEEARWVFSGLTARVTAPRDCRRGSGAVYPV